MTRAAMSRVQDAFASIPPMRAETVLPLVNMLMRWIGLMARACRKTGFPCRSWCWRSLPNAARHMKDATRDRMVWMSAMMIAAFAVHAAYWFTVLLVMPPDDSPA